MRLASKTYFFLQNLNISSEFWCSPKLFSIQKHKEDILLRRWTWKFTKKESYTQSPLSGFIKCPSLWTWLPGFVDLQVNVKHAEWSCECLSAFVTEEKLVKMFWVLKPKVLSIIWAKFQDCSKTPCEQDKRESSSSAQSPSLETTLQNLVRKAKANQNLTLTFIIGNKFCWVLPQLSTAHWRKTLMPWISNC